MPLLSVSNTERMPYRRTALATILTATFAVCVSSPAVGATPAKLSAKQSASLQKACKYFSYDYSSLVGELKMSNLTGQDLTEGARYVTEDLEGARPAVRAPQRVELTQAQKVLARAETVPSSQPVPTRTKNALGRTFQSAPFSTLGRTFQSACRRLPKRR